MAEEKMYLGKVPKSVYDKELKAYLKRKQSARGARPVRATFEYKGEKFSWHGDGKGGYKLDPQAKRAQTQAVRKGRKTSQQIKLSTAEQMMVDNLFEEASRRGLQVEHKIPLSKGGPSNAPWNLGLMSGEENRRKGDIVGGNWRYEPLIELDFSKGSASTRRRVVSIPVEEPLDLTPNIPGSASEEIRAMQGTVPDAIRIQPGMSLPGNSLIQGI